MIAKNSKIRTVKILWDLRETECLSIFTKYQVLEINPDFTEVIKDCPKKSTLL